MAEERIPKDKVVFRKKKDGSGGAIPINKETGEPGGKLGEKIEWDKPENQQERRHKVVDVLGDIVRGKGETTIPGLRNDLEQYGGTNDVTTVMGNRKKGLIHIAKRHGEWCIPYVLEAMANGKIENFVAGNKTVHIVKDGYDAVLSLDEDGKKKTWLLTGFDIREPKQKKAAKDESGKVSARHASTQNGPILSRSDLVAYAAFKKKITEALKKVNQKKQYAENPDRGALDHFCCRLAELGMDVFGLRKGA